MRPPCVEDRKEDSNVEGAASPVKRESRGGPSGWRRISVSAGVAELADARDLKSRGPKGRPGSIPGPGTISFGNLTIRPWRGAMAEAGSSPTLTDLSLMRFGAPSPAAAGTVATASRRSAAAFCFCTTAYASSRAAPSRSITSS